MLFRRRVCVFFVLVLLNCFKTTPRLLTTFLLLLLSSLSLSLSLFIAYMPLRSFVKPPPIHSDSSSFVREKEKEDNNTNNTNNKDRSNSKRSTLEGKGGGFLFVQSLFENTPSVSHVTLASAAVVAVLFSATTTASVVHARNRKHKLERDLPAKVHAKAAIHGLKALAVATGLSGTVAVAACLSTQHIFPSLWEKESVKEKLEAAVRSVPGGEAFNTKETTKRNRK